ncbi:DUF445 domain-containing protein [Formicincola oecophyllae]|uniref:DUF445 domain-containing protein n=2 Tax=Formicincola oecophyllae TaxID=2558361 RepID=A0A4Y6UD03_9PROT|nr:DUF445 domain-containing protein [Formicincola oecophyllae]
MAGLATTAALPVWVRWWGHPWWLDMIRAGTQAGVVGGLADWFAVTALFRHPMGLPIPHTAILPARKKQIGEGLGRFVAEQFFTDADVSRVLAKVDFARLLARALSTPETAQALNQRLRGAIPGVLAKLNGEEGARTVSNVMEGLLQGADLTPAVVRGLKAMVAGDVHQEVFSFFLAQFRDLVMTRETELRDFVAKRVREQGGRLVGWALGSAVADQVLGALKMELERVDPMDSDLRHGFTRWIRGKVDSMEAEPERADAMMKAVRGFVGHDSLREWGGELWKRLQSRAVADSGRDDGWTAQVFDSFIKQFAETLDTNRAVDEGINSAVRQGLLRMLPAARAEIARFIPQVVERWDGPGLSERLERGVGQDLAFIRINGTVVGLLAGALLEGVFMLCFGS